MVDPIAPDLSLCLPVSDGGADLAPFLEAVSATDDHLGLEIIIVCGRGDVGQLDVWADQAGVGVLVCPGRFSPVRAFNVAASAARGRYLAFWDYRMLPVADSLMILASFLDDHPDVALVAPKIVREGRTWSPARQIPSLAELWFGTPGRIMPGWQEYGSGEADWLCSPAMLVNRHAYAEISPLVPWLPSLWTLALAVDLRRLGWHIHYRHDAQVEGPSGGGGSPHLAERVLAASMLLKSWWWRLRGY